MPHQQAAPADLRLPRLRTTTPYVPAVRALAGGIRACAPARLARAAAAAAPRAMGAPGCPSRSRTQTAPTRRARRWRRAAMPGTGAPKPAAAMAADDQIRSLRSDAAYKASAVVGSGPSPLTNSAGRRDAFAPGGLAPERTGSGQRAQPGCGRRCEPQRSPRAAPRRMLAAGAQPSSLGKRRARV